jgi:MFS transporter, SP family, arabinose:H+ symporter
MSASQTAAALAGESALSDRGSAWCLAGICLAASLGGLLFGFDTAVISGTIESVKGQYHLNDIQEGWFGSSALAGCVLGAAAAGTFSDRFGRKPALRISAVLFLSSALCAAAAPGFDWLIGGRILAGLGVGVASVVAPMYISEFSPPRLRGRLVAFYQLSIVLGILAAYFSNWLLLSFAQSHPLALADIGWLRQAMVAETWRAMFAVGAIPAVLFLGLVLAVPESPRWLVKAGRTAEALRGLARVEGAEAARREIGEIRHTAEEESGSIGELLKPGLRMAMIVGLGLSVFGQMSGVNIVIYYGPKILQGAGFTSASALQWQVVIGIINLVFTLAALWKVDSWGRRPLLIRGMAVVALSMLATAGLYYWKAPSIWIVAMLCIYIASEALSICAVIWILTAEIFPTRVRGRAVSIAIFANWGTNWFSALLFPWYVKVFGLVTGFLTFAVICFAATLFFQRFVPETKGKSLEEIAAYWQS